MISYGPAASSDIPALAFLYQDAFPEALTVVFGRPRISPRAVEDVFDLLYRLEPSGFFVARDGARTAGFMVVNRDMASLRRHLMRYGGTLAARWLTGGYPELGFGFLPRLLKAWWQYRSADSGDTGPAPMAQVLTIVVEPGSRGQGIGKGLSLAALNYLRGTPARSVRLEVDAAKAVPVALYRQLGFETRSTIPSPRGPALVMTLQLR